MLKLTRTDIIMIRIHISSAYIIVQGYRFELYILLLLHFVERLLICFVIILKLTRENIITIIIIKHIRDNIVTMQLKTILIALKLTRDMAVRTCLFNQSVCLSLIATISSDS